MYRSDHYNTLLFLFRSCMQDFLVHKRYTEFKREKKNPLHWAFKGGPWPFQHRRFVNGVINTSELIQVLLECVSSLKLNDNSNDLKNEKRRWLMHHDYEFLNLNVYTGTSWQGVSSFEMKEIRLKISVAIQTKTESRIWRHVCDFFYPLQILVPFKLIKYSA